MGIESILENKMPKAIEYASHIITETESFIDFSVAMVNYIGIDFIPYCKSVYVLLKSLPHLNIDFETDDSLSSITPDVIRNAYNKFLSQQNELKREKSSKTI